jgi:2-keto-4-pentenoate hydratase
MRTMLDSTRIAAASRTLSRHWRAGTRLGNLETAQRPQSREEGYAIQAELEHSSSHKLFGWKIAATSEAGQKHINVAGPMAGRILQETLIEEGGTASMAGNAMAVAEPEFAFRMHVDLRPRPAPYSAEEVFAAVDTLHPAIEIPDSRFAEYVKAGEAQIIADNACAHLVEQRPVITLRGQRYVGHGRNVLGDPRVALVWLANELRGLGVTLKAGEVVTTGTCHPPLPIQSGDRMEADFGVLGKVSVGFE